MSAGVNVLEANKNLADILSKSQKDDKLIKQQADQIDRLTNKTDELEKQLARLKPFEALIGNLPEEFSFTIKDKMLLTAIISPGINKYKIKGNPFDPKLPKSTRESAERYIDRLVISALEWVFMRSENLDAMMKQKKLLVYDREVVDDAEGS